MYEDDEFEDECLVPQIWQYSVRHHSPLEFVFGERVFLMCNAEVVLTVYGFNAGLVRVYWYSLNNEFIISEFPPECLLQYKWRPFITYNRKYNICLN